MLVVCIMQQALQPFTLMKADISGQNTKQGLTQNNQFVYLHLCIFIQVYLDFWKGWLVEASDRVCCKSCFNNQKLSKVGNMKLIGVTSCFFSSACLLYLSFSVGVFWDWFASHNSLVWTHFCWKCWIFHEPPV